MIKEVLRHKTNGKYLAMDEGGVYLINEPGVLFNEGEAESYLSDPDDEYFDEAGNNGIFYSKDLEVVKFKLTEIE